MIRRSPLRGLVLVGTDTGVGKTVVAAGLIRLASQQRIALLPFKPAETGCPAPDHPSDALLLRLAAGRPDLPLDAVCPFRFHPPVAPAAAAAALGTRLRLTPLVRAARNLATLGAHGILVEGAGGILSPYASDLTILDLAARLRLPLLLVSRNSLGTINHTALAVREIRRRALPLLGYVLVDSTAPPAPAQRNEALIRELTGLKPYARLRHLRVPSPETAAHALRTSLPVRRFLRGLLTR